MIDITHGASLLPFNTFGIDAKASVLIEYDTVDDLCKLYADGMLSEPVLNVGQGSNLLFVGDYQGTVLHSRNKILEISPNTDGSCIVKAGAGWRMDELIERTIAEGLAGLENLSGIPGEAGSSAVQNVGAYGVEAADRIVGVEAFDMKEGSVAVFNNADCAFAYRDSRFKRPDQKRWIITAVTYRLGPTIAPVLTYGALAAAFADTVAPKPANIRTAIMEMRASKLPDPAVIGSAGSFFTNPIVSETKAEALLKVYPDMPAYPVGEGLVKLSAGWLIDRAGWKGCRMGRAGVYSCNALVLVNLGGATGSEILALARAVMADIDTRYGISLRPEVNIL